MGIRSKEGLASLVAVVGLPFLKFLNLCLFLPVLPPVHRKVMELSALCPEGCRIKFNNTGIALEIITAPVKVLFVEEEI